MANTSRHYWVVCGLPCIGAFLFAGLVSRATHAAGEWPVVPRDPHSVGARHREPVHIANDTAYTVRAEHLRREARKVQPDTAAIMNDLASRHEAITGIRDGDRFRPALRGPQRAGAIQSLRAHENRNAPHLAAHFAGVARTTAAHPTSTSLDKAVAYRNAGLASEVAAKAERTAGRSGHTHKANALEHHVTADHHMADHFDGLAHDTAHEAALERDAAAAARQQGYGTNAPIDAHTDRSVDLNNEAAEYSQIAGEWRATAAARQAGRAPQAAPPSRPPTP
jgi:hypothetical protein